MPIRNKLPVFSATLPVEAMEAGRTFYDDMYGEDKLIRERFAGKQASEPRNCPV